LGFRGGLEALKTILKLLYALAVAVVTVWSFRIPPAMGFQQPDLAKIFVWHFPCPMIATVLLMMGAYFSFKFVRTHDQRWDERASTATELGYVFALLTMATGILFSEVQWGAWWSWDPRQTSFLMVLLLYAAYFVVRAAFGDPDRRASQSAAYALAAVLPALFLIFVYPRLPQVLSQSLHPSDSILAGKIKGEYLYVVLSVMALMTVLTVWLYRLRLQAGLIVIESEDSHERLAIRGGDPAPSGVVRRIPVPPENRS
jgi:heme exporter protein C